MSFGQYSNEQVNPEYLKQQQEYYNQQRMSQQQTDPNIIPNDNIINKTLMESMVQTSKQLQFQISILDREHKVYKGLLDNKKKLHTLLQAEHKLYNELLQITAEKLNNPMKNLEEQRKLINEYKAYYTKLGELLAKKKTEEDQQVVYSSSVIGAQIDANVLRNGM